MFHMAHSIGVNRLLVQAAAVESVAGPTSCGKTQFTFRLIQNASQMISLAPTKIYYCYGEYQPIFAKYPRVIFNEGLQIIESSMADIAVESSASANVGGRC